MSFTVTHRIPSYVLLVLLIGIIIYATVFLVDHFSSSDYKIAFVIISILGLAMISLDVLRINEIGRKDKVENVGRPSIASKRPSSKSDEHFKIQQPASRESEFSIRPFPRDEDSPSPTLLESEFPIQPFPPGEDSPSESETSFDRKYEEEMQKLIPGLKPSSLLTHQMKRQRNLRRIPGEDVPSSPLSSEPYIPEEPLEPTQPPEERVPPPPTEEVLEGVEWREIGRNY
jgi:hypothetical protein